MKTFFFWLILMIPGISWGQRSVQGLPVDNKGTPLVAALGLPFSCEKTVTTATYTEYCDMPANTGNNQGRMYRGIQIYNPSTTDSAYLCFGDATGCSTDMIKVRPGCAVSQDFALFGPGNNVTRIWLRLESAGSEVIDVNLW